MSWAYCLENANWIVARMRKIELNTASQVEGVYLIFTKLSNFSQTGE